MLGAGRGPYYRFLKEYGVPEKGIDFGPGNIHVVRDEQGREIDDIVEEGDNACVLSKCMELAFHFTKNPDQVIFFSIAGGRKTMGACLTLAAQMYARPQDRLYHVIIAPEFEGCRNFFYPPKKPETIELRDSQGRLYSMSTRHAKVNLVHMPFFSIRSQLSPEVLDQPRDPATLMLSLIREEPEKLVVNLNEGKVCYRGAETDMMPARMALYAFFALRKKACPQPDASCRSCDHCFIDVQGVMQRQHEITALYKRLRGSRPIEEMSTTGIVGLNPENFSSYKTHANRDLKNAFGLPAMEKLEIASVGSKPNTRFGLYMDRNAIEVVM